MLLQFLVWHYGRGAVRAALDEGARAGAATTDPADCEARANAALAQLLGGHMGRTTTITCTARPDQMAARAAVAFPAWLDGIPAWTFDLEATVAIEQLP